MAPGHYQTSMVTTSSKSSSIATDMLDCLASASSVLAKLDNLKQTLVGPQPSEPPSSSKESNNSLRDVVSRTQRILQECHNTLDNVLKEVHQ